MIADSIYRFGEFHFNLIFAGAYDQVREGGVSSPRCAAGSDFDVSPKSVTLSVPTSTFRPATTSSAAPVSTTTTTSRPAAAGRIGGSLVNKVVALAGAAAVVVALGV